MQKSFLSSLDIFADKTFNGIVDVFDEIIESFFLVFNIFSFKKDKLIYGKKVILKEPIKENWKEWAELRQSSREFLQPWEPKWPNNFLSRNTFYSFINMVEIASRNKSGHNFFIFDINTASRSESVSAS